MGSKKKHQRTSTGGHQKSAVEKKKHLRSRKFSSKTLLCFRPQDLRRKTMKPNLESDTGGYINEGGLLKSRNGQKYIINNPERGRFCSNIVIGCLIGLIVLLFFATVTLLVLMLHADTKHCRLQDPKVRVPSDTRLNTAGYQSTKDMIEDDYFSEEEANGVDQGVVKQDRISRANGWFPQHYKLIIEANIEQSTNNGTVWIDVSLNQNAVPRTRMVPLIVLDTTDIRIVWCKVYNSVDGASMVSQQYYTSNNASYIINLGDGTFVKRPEKLNLTLELTFESRLSDTLQGFYRGYFADPDERNSRSWFASTQFSPIDARRAFPCFDSPNKKATFEISIVHPSDHFMTLSNMARIKRTDDVRSGYVQDDFEVTPRMSTYLVAFITSNLELAQHSQGFRPVVNVWTRSEVRHQTNYAYSLTMRILPFLEEYFGMPYHLRKLDLVAVPDFGFRAMENWGLIMFRESALLVPEDSNRSSSAKHKEAVASVVAHELVHQWFGNLVTPHWWNDLWLKEGFATYLSYMCLNTASILEKQWHMFESFAQKELQEAFEKDSDRNSHQISFPVDTASDIRRIFDPISYSKGAAIVRMMDSFLGGFAFKLGINEYLLTYQFDNAEQDDLWQILTVHGHRAGTLPASLDVKQIMETWTLQPGYPVITIERNGTGLVVSQQRYLLPSREHSDATRWYVPLTLVIESQQHKSPIVHWIPYDNKTISFTVEAEADEYLYANVDRTGYYRVNYDYASWKKLTNNFMKLPPLTRLQLVDDAFQLARAEFIQYDIPLTLILLVTQNPHDVPAWAALTRSLVYINYMLAREPAYETYLAVMRSTLRRAFDEFGFDDRPNDSHVEMTHRERVVGLACLYGMDKCSMQAQTLFRSWMTDFRDNRIPPNLKEIIYCTSLRDGGVPEWNFAFERYQETDSASEKELILNALGCTLKPWLLSKYLNMTISPASGILKQDGVRAFQAVATNYVGTEIAFNFLYENIEHINDYYGDGFSTLAKMIDSAALLMNKPHHKEQFDRFAHRARRLGLPAIEQSIRLAKEQILNNIYWRSRSYYQLQQFLEQLIEDLHINIY